MVKKLSTDQEIRTFLERKIDVILEERKKEREHKKEESLKEEKRISAEKKIINTVKESLHETLKDVDWENLNIESTTKLIKNVNKWVKQYTKK